MVSVIVPGPGEFVNLSFPASHPGFRRLAELGGGEFGCSQRPQIPNRVKDGRRPLDKKSALDLAHFF